MGSPSESGSQHDYKTPSPAAPPAIPPYPFPRACARLLSGLCSANILCESVAYHLQQVSSVPADATSPRAALDADAAARSKIKQPHAAAPLGVSHWSELTVGSPELKPPCARGHVRSTYIPRTPSLCLSYFPPC